MTSSLGAGELMGFGSFLKKALPFAATAAAGYATGGASLPFSSSLFKNASLSDVGNVLQGVSSFVNRPPSPGKATAQALRAQVQTARELGLHPLAVIGAGGGSYSGPVSTGSALGDGIGALGDSLAGIGNRRDAAKGNKLNERLIQEQIAEARSRTQLNKANTLQSLSRVGSGVAGGGMGAPQTIGTSPHTPEGLAPGAARPKVMEPHKNVPATTTMNVFGHDVEILGPDGEPVDPFEALMMGLTALPQIAQKYIRKAEQKASRAGRRPRPPRPAPPGGRRSTRARDRYYKLRRFD